jgi:hypothetical protein
MDNMFDTEIREQAPDGKKVEEGNDFQKACDAFVCAHRKFARLDLASRTDASANAGEWFPALKQKYLTEERIWELFCSGFETTQMTRLYLEFRGCLLRGESLKPNA